MPGFQLYLSLLPQPPSPSVVCGEPRDGKQRMSELPAKSSQPWEGCKGEAAPQNKGGPVKLQEARYRVRPPGGVRENDTGLTPVVSGGTILGFGPCRASVGWH